MLSSKQRAFLRGLANTLDTILIIGKGGLNDQVINQADTALTARELIKCKVLETAELSSKDYAEQISKVTNSDVVQVIGTKFILFRRNNKEPKIELPDEKKKKK